MDELAALWLAALPLMGSPGPATLSLAAVGAAFGARAGAAYLCGIIAGTFGVLMLVAGGITGLILARPGLATAATAVAAAYILYLAYRIATAPPVAASDTDTAPPSFPGGFGLAIANPKAFAAIGAVYAGHTLLTHDLVLDAVAKVAALSVVIVAVNAGWLVFGTALSALLRDRRAGRVANAVFAAMLVASLALALLVG